MNEIIEKFEDLSKKTGLVVSKCRNCGQLPVLKTLYDDLDKETRIECKCGIRIPVSQDMLKDIISYWNQVNGFNDYIPNSKPRYIGKGRECMTCMNKKRCTEARRLPNLTEYVCYDWVEEKIKEC